MGEHTEISWTHHTFNPWVGCTKVSAACDHCYAESWAKRSGHPELWHGQRRRTSAANWREPFKWGRAAKAASERRRVFCASLADVFDNQVPDLWRSDLFAVIEDTPDLDWLLLTKRPQNVARMIWPKWDNRLPSNIWLGTTTENQPQFDSRWPFISDISARVRFISYEPALGPLTLTDNHRANPDWIICGGESGPHHRKMDLNWARDIRDECSNAGIAFHFKQVGGLRPKDGGNMLDGRTHLEIPA